MASKFDLGSFRGEIAGFHSSAELELQNAEKRRELADVCIKKIKETARIAHQKLHKTKEITDKESICFEFLDKISAESRTPYEKLLEIKERNNGLLVYLKDLMKKIDAALERISDRKEVSYTERNFVENNQEKLRGLSEQAAKDDCLLELFEEDVMPVVDRVLVGVN